MYHDYFDATDGSGLRNPYAPAESGPDDRPTQRQRLILLGMIGAGLSVVAPTVARTPGRTTTEQAVVLDLPTGPLFG